MDKRRDIKKTIMSIRRKRTNTIKKDTENYDQQKSTEKF